MRSFVLFIDGISNSNDLNRIAAAPPRWMFWKGAFVLLAVFIPLMGLSAQQAPVVAQWEGLLENAGRAPIEGAMVKLNSDSNAAEAVTGKDGRFKMQAVAIGRYKLTVLANGRTIEGGQSVNVAQGGARRWPSKSPIAES